MSIRNLKDGSKKPWLCECYPNGRNGKRVRKRFTTKGEAAAFELHIMKQIDDKPWMGEKPDHRRLSDLLELWWEVHGKNLKAGQVAYEVIAKTINILGDPIAIHLTATDYLKYRSKRVTYRGNDKSVPISATTHNHELTYLRSMYNRLIKYRLIKYPNPLESIELIKQEQRELTFLTKNQIRSFLNTLGNYDRCIKVSIPQLVVIAKICLATGARINEALRLQHSQITQYKITFTETKGKRNRTVPISETLYDEIIAIAISENEIFNQTYKDAWRYIKKSLPDTVPDGQATHILRDTFATHFMMNRGNILVLQRILGHQKIEHTMIYAHFAPEHLIQAVELNPLEN